ncbi:MAG: glutamine-hydrolyzing carbamoyl-phosphate synthase small subunit [Chloroflexi bacterium]|nr:glutamine-hydrolyzing carbamoyl-phosphate synthase small subunit [Chloroflexota bacterium]
MPRDAILVLEDGSVYQGYGFGAEGRAWGEVVFNTAMTGYQEMLTDPSYAGQIVVPTYPLIGNYGVNREDFESRRIQVSGFVVREECAAPSHWQSTGTVAEFLASQGIPGIAGVDTRAITRRLRLAGVMMGTITCDETAEQALARLRELPRYDSFDFVRQVSTEMPYTWSDNGPTRPSGAVSQKTMPPLSVSERGLRGEGPAPHIVALDCGLKFNILRSLRRLGCSVTAVPAATSAEDIFALKPDGVVLSPGPGDPALLGYVTETTRALVGKLPVMGICLGHQMLAWAFGGRTYKLKFGHRGANHPVKDLATGLVYITAQNHGYAVDADSLPPGVEVSHLNLNDGTVEGLRHQELPIISIQYHSEASPGPWDNMYLFERFVEMVRGNDV